MIVMKFGGTSVSSKSSIEQIKYILTKKSDNYLVVVSAFSGVTNTLEELGSLALANNYTQALEAFRKRHIEVIKDIVGLSDQTDLIMVVQQKYKELEEICQSIHILQEFSPRTQANILSIGEELSSQILCHYLNLQGVSLDHLDSKKMIRANRDYLNGEVDFKTTNENILSGLEPKNYITGGFVAANGKGETVTLGRGGSDYTAAIYASALGADCLEIWSDVDGLHSANPRIVNNTKAIGELSYEEALELAYFGAKVLYPPSVLPVMRDGIPLYLKNTFKPELEGTLVSDKNVPQEDKVLGLSSLKDMAVITVSGIGLARQKGRARKIFQILEENEINVILITQCCSEQSIGIGIAQNDLAIAKAAISTQFEKEIQKGVLNAPKIIQNQCIIALVGDNMKNKIGLSGKVFSAIGENGININAIAQGASERNISIVIDQAQEEKALNVIHEKFFSSSVKTIHLFIAGIGNVGKEFLKVIDMQRSHLLDDLNIKLKVVGVSNSKRFLFNQKDGISSEQALNINETGKEYHSFEDFIEEIKSMNLSNSVFIDNTASSIVSNTYPELLAESISVITCNKIACSSEFSYYQKLQKLAKEFNAFFKYETAVGAALPIIKTIHDLKISGDQVNQIEAVISGSLNFIFNQYAGDRTFSQVVRQAKDEGYTEPDPLIDLSGLDVMRKILILSREAGYESELSDITFNDFLPEECSSAKGIDELFSSLENHEEHFKALYEKANLAGRKLKILASMNEGKMKVELKEIEPDSPLYNLEGKDNVVAINTNRYITEPMVIKGAGAGASVTASGVFADLMYVVNR